MPTRQHAHTRLYKFTNQIIALNIINTNNSFNFDWYHPIRLQQDSMPIYG